MHSMHRLEGLQILGLQLQTNLFQAFAQRPLRGLLAIFKMPGHATSPVLIHKARALA